MKRLQDFQNTVNETIFTDDKTYQDLMIFFLGDTESERVGEVLRGWEKHIPYWNVLADEASRPEKLPRIQKYDRVGNPIEDIYLPLETQLLRHRVVEHGIFDGKTELEKFSKIYLLSQIGESSVTCPLACTDGLIRVLEANGSEYLQNIYIEQLRSTETPLCGSQFVTERAGGSDVGAIEAVAKQVSPGEYRIYGQKWFCSTPDELFLVAARIEGAPDGTKGISIFLVPRLIPNNGSDGADVIPNNLSIDRLKDKFGTQSLPTAEIEFEGSHAYLIGQESEGFTNLMNYVLNCSRIHNTASALGAHRRAFIEARNYAQQRVAFGDYIINYPLVAESLVNLLSRLSSKQALFLNLLSLIDQNGWLPKDDHQRLWQRFLINMLKYRSSFELTERIKEAILIFGANGIVNDFSILPRLLRDAMVVETWEGTHNTLCLQIMRDIQKSDIVSKLNQEIENILSDWPDGVMKDSKEIFLQNVDKGRKIFDAKTISDSKWAQTHAKRFVDHFATLLETGYLVRAGVEMDNCNLLIQASYLIHELLSDRYAGFVSPAVENLTGICQDLILERPIDIEVD